MLVLDGGVGASFGGWGTSAGAVKKDVMGGWSGGSSVVGLWSDWGMGFASAMSWVRAAQIFDAPSVRISVSFFSAVLLDRVFVAEQYVADA